ncbi:MAG: hypothetical protein H0W21_06655, partial [Actinobacteria bacterium]|nr:hypothetical protein [Actinomycetota bacterium]
MTDKAMSRLAWVTFGFIALGFVSGLGYGALSGRGVDLFVTSMFSFPVVGVLITSRQPRNTIGWILLAIGLVWMLGIAFAVAQVLWPSEVGLLLALSTWLWVPGIGLIGTFLILLFPDGRLPSSRWRPWAWLCAIALIASSLLIMLAPGNYADEGYPNVTNPLGIEVLKPFFGVVWVFIALIPIGIVGCAVSLIRRFRRSEGQERLQLKWLAAGAGGAAAAYLFVMVSGLPYGIADRPVPEWVNVVGDVGIFSFLLIPVAAGVAILKYRLYDIDVIITKTVVFGALAAFITVVYVAVVAGVAAALGAGRGANLPLSILATVIVAVAFQPVRERLRRFANRLVYGERATPYEVLTLFSRSLAALVSVEDVLPEIARHTAQGLGAQTVRVSMDLPQGKEEARYPEDGSPGGESLEETVPVTYQGATLGAIAVLKPASEPFRAPERRLLGQLAAHAGVVLHNYQLTLELRARLLELSEQADNLRRSRERLVTAADTSRRAIERAIRERVERRLVLIADDLRIAEAAMRTDADKATAILEELALRTNETLEVLRDLARGIYPPLLADKGLVMALEAHIRKTGLDASLRADSAIEGVRFER